MLEQSLNDNETYLAEVVANAQSAQLWVKGKFKNRNITLGEDMPEFSTGTFLNSNDYYAGLFEHTAIGDTVLFCCSRQVEDANPPVISKFFIVAGDSTVLPKGTKLFHCSGEVTINGNAVVKPTQVRSKANELNITAITDCYGMIFA